jgi:hypothetical protein
MGERPIARLFPHLSTRRRATIIYVAPSKFDVTMTMLVRAKRPISHLVAAISDIDGVQEVGRVDRGAEFE